MWLTEYRHDIQQRPEGWVVLIWNGRQLIQRTVFESCNAALSFVERREGCQVPTPF